MKYLLHTLVIVSMLLAGAGCRASSPVEKTEATSGFPYAIRIIKSADVVKNLSFQSPYKETNVLDLTRAAGIAISFEMRNVETITSLDGVITTASKGWQVYVNGKASDAKYLTDVQVKSGDDVEWRYE